MNDVRGSCKHILLFPRRHWVDLPALTQSAFLAKNAFTVPTIKLCMSCSAGGLPIMRSCVRHGAESILIHNYELYSIRTTFGSPGFPYKLITTGSSPFPFTGSELRGVSNFSFLAQEKHRMKRIHPTSHVIAMTSYVIIVELMQSNKAIFSS